MTYTITKNEAFNSFEILFDSKPSEEVREALKSLRYRWHKVKGIWYGYGDENTVREAIENATKGVKTTKATKTAKKVEKVNKYGVKVGDVFEMSWGYEQSNVDFYQVTELVGEQSVRIIHVSPEVLKVENEGYMCGTYTYNITPEIMRKDYGVHLKDSDKGDVKRVLKSGETLYLNMSSYANAYKIPFGAYKCYESSYA